MATGGKIMSPAQKKQKKKIEPNAKTKMSPRAARANSPRAAPVRREPLPQKRGRRGPKNRSSIYCGVCKSRGSWEARVFIKECVACGTKTTPQWRNIESKAYCVSP